MDTSRQLMIIKNIMRNMKPEQRDQIEKIRSQITKIVEASGDEGYIGLSLVGLEQSTIRQQLGPQPNPETKQQEN